MQVLYCYITPDLHDSSSEVAVDSSQKRVHLRIIGLPILAAVLLLSTTSYAASNAVVECDQVGRDLQSLEVNVNDIAVDAVDHTPLDSDIVDQNAEASETVAPILNLGPRVTNIMRDVFEAADEELADDAPATSSPLADSDEQKSDGEADDTPANVSELLRFQRMMRRTDI